MSAPARSSRARRSGRPSADRVPGSDGSRASRSGPRSGRPAAPVNPAVPENRSAPDRGPGRRRGPGADPVPGPRRRLLVLAEAALVPVAASYLAVVGVGLLVTALATGTTGADGGVGRAAAVGVPLWLAAHLVPLQLDGAPVGAWPLLPAIFVGLAVAAAARRGSRRLGGRRVGGDVAVVTTVAVAHAACGVLAAALLAPETVVDASPARAGLGCGALAAVAATAGAAGGSVRAAVRERWPGWLRRGVRTGLLATTLLVAAAAALLLGALLAQGPAVVAAVERLAPAAGSGTGLSLLSVAYLPNAVLAALAWLLGPGVGLGVAAAAPTAVVAGPVAPLPLAVVLPAAPPPSWAALAFAVPLAVGSLVGWRVAPQATADRLRSLAAATVVVAGSVAVLASLAGGRLGTGPFDPLTLHPALLLPVAAAWIAVPGAVVALLAVPLGSPGPTLPRRPRPAGRTRDRPAAGTGGAGTGGAGTGGAGTGDGGWGPASLAAVRADRPA